MSQTSQALIEWSDIIKLLIGFAISLVMIWAKNEGERRLQAGLLKRSLWRVARHHTDLKAFIDDLDLTVKHAANGRVWISSVDFSEHFSAMVAELSRLEPKYADLCLNYLSAEHVVLQGYRQLVEMRMHLVKARKQLLSPPDEEASVKSAIAAQCLALKKDLRKLAQRELDLLKALTLRWPFDNRADDAKGPIRQLLSSLAQLDAALKAAP